MKYHKIRGVDKSTCTAEQKIAYNMAWYIWNDCRYNWTDCRTRIDWSEQENAAIWDYTDNWQRNYAEKNKKYDIDSIFCALRAGLHDYLTGSVHVFTSYQDIGEAFPANYMEA